MIARTRSAYFRRLVYAPTFLLLLSVIACGDPSGNGSGDTPTPGDDDAQGSPTPQGDDDLTAASPAPTPGHVSPTPSGDDDTGPAATPTPTSGPESPTPDPTPYPDTDQDKIPNYRDNCVDQANTDQADADDDDVGDVCDKCPDDPGNDPDLDEWCALEDNCPDVANPDQLDGDSDGRGDACDPCPDSPLNDSDLDGTCDVDDNCAEAGNPNQMDRDLDGAGDACDPCPDHNPDDPDGDEVCGPPVTPAPDGSFYLLGTVPDDGFRGVALEPPGRIFLSEPYRGAQDKVHVSIVSQYSDLEPQEVGFGDMVMTFSPTLAPDTDYCLMVEIEPQDGVPGRWPILHTACFTTRVPCGIPIDVGNDLSIDKLGDNPGVSLIINGIIQANGYTFPVFIVLEHLNKKDNFPISDVDVAVGAYVKGEDGSLEVIEDGFATTFYGCYVDSLGHFDCAADVAIFPFETEDFGMNLEVQDAQIQGKLLYSGSVQGMDDFQFEGAITLESMLELENVSGTSGISSLIELDRDLDGDGTDDAATVIVASSPRSISIDAVKCP